MAKSIPVTISKNLSILRTDVPQSRRNACSVRRKIFALDTETDRNGDIFLIADSDGNYLDDITPENLIRFLFQKRYQGTWNFFYNITFDSEVILKVFGEEILYNYKRTRKLKFAIEDYKLDYIPSKILAIRKGHHSTVFFDIAQYYHASLTNAYQQNIGTLDESYLKIKQKRSAFSRNYYLRYMKKVKDYCIQDCILTKELTNHWTDLFYDAFGFYPMRWISSGYLAEKVLINNNIPLPKFDQIPYKIQDIAWSSYFGGRFEVLKRGFIGTAYIFDINSAYPYALSIIPDFFSDNKKHNWKKSKKILENALLGFFKIESKIPNEKYVPPFPFNDGRLIFPSGKFQTFCTLAELKAVQNPKYYKILESWQYCDDHPSYPYKDFVESTYQKRLSLKQAQNPLQLPLKIILNSIYGKTGQKVNRRIGNIFSPVIFSSITGIARSMLYRFVMENNIEKDVVFFATDSVCTTRKLDYNSDKLGEFSYDNSADDVYVLQNGFYRFNEKWKQRGLGNLGTKEIEHLDTIERGDDLFYTYKVLRSNRLRSSILSDSVSDIGKFTTFERQVNLNADKKRLWFEKLRSIQEKRMINSMPINLNYL